MVKTRMNTADMAAEVKCLRRLIGMRCSNVYGLSPKTYVFKLRKSSGVTESGESEKVLMLMESGVRLHTTAYVRDKSNGPSGFTLKLRKHIRKRRLEDVRQLGYDSIVLFQFGLGENAHYVILELYAQGNIILTDHEFTVLTLLRSHRDDDKGFAIMSRHKYPTEICRVFERTTPEKLQEALASCKEVEKCDKSDKPKKDKQGKSKGGKPVESNKSNNEGNHPKRQTLMTVLGEALGYGPALSEHMILDAGLSPITKISKDNKLDDDTVQVLVHAVAKFENLLQDVISGDKVPEGYILMLKKNVGKDFPASESGDSYQIYDEFCPILLNQFRTREYTNFNTFDDALDEFYSKIESEPDYCSQISDPEHVSRNEGGDGQLEVDAAVTQVGNKNERKRKKRKRDKHEDDVLSNNETDCTNPVEGNVVNTDSSGNEARNRLEETTNMLEKSKPKRTYKRVTFSQDVEVFSSEAPTDEKGDMIEELVRWKRFSLEEDKLIKEAVFKYIESHQLGEEGLEKVLHCTKYKIRNCWKEIGEYLPWRPYTSVYFRAHTLFERDEDHSWTPEELDVVRNYANKHAGKWKDLAAVLGKNRVHVANTWRRVRLANMKRGAWSQDEYQTLFDLVNTDMRMKVNEVRKSKYGMLRDNISWMAICTKLQTRTDATCCAKWYEKLASPMVADGKWFDSDDYHLVIALYDLDAFCIEDVDWDNLLEHRPGHICRKRWNQMVRHLGDNVNKPFSEQVEVLLKRYCPDVLEAREAYNANTTEH